MKKAEELAQNQKNIFHIAIARIGLYRMFLMLFLFVVVFLSLTFPILFNRVTLKEGEVAEWDILSPITGKIETQLDKTATDVLRTKSTESVQTVYSIDTSVVNVSTQRINSFFKKIKQLKNPALTEAEKNGIRISLEFDLPAKHLDVFLQTDFHLLNILESITLKAVRAILMEGLDDVKSIEVKKEVQNIVNGYGLQNMHKNAVREAILAALVPNKSINTKETEKRKRLAKELITPTFTSLKRGSPIVFKGERIDVQHIAVFKALNMYGNSIDWPLIAASAGLEILLLFLFFSYLYYYRKKIYNDSKKLLITVILITITLLLARIITGWNGHYVPLPAVAMLLVIFVDGPAAIITTVLLSLLVGFIYHFDISIMIMMLLGSFLAISRSTGVFQRTTLTQAGFWIALSNMFVVLAVAIMQKNFVWQEVFPNVFAGIVNGVFSAIFVIGTLPYWESFFKIATPMKLGELADPHQPALKRLLVEAPGTYHHSLMVATMAESAAELVGANSLLARVGAYYHDIGKIKRPAFFVENQVAGENPHDRISARLSTLIILAHLRDGVELAEKYRLPNEVIEIIAQHHGTSIISYFYREYLAKGKEDEKIDPNDFRYEGPAPRSKEAAIVMLADSVEAAVRSIERPTLHKMESLIRKIFKDRLDDGQLDECHLTLRDLDRIREAFLYVLSGRFHGRIEYPEKDFEDDESLKNIGSRFDIVGD